MAKVKIVKKKLVDQDLASMFNDMLSGGDATIIAEKTQKARAAVKMVVTIARGIASPTFRRDFPEYAPWCDEFQQFAARTEALLELDWAAFKEHNDTRQLVLVCRELVQYAHFLEEGNLVERDASGASTGRLRDRWITTHPGLTYEPFAFTKMDLKHIWGNQRVVPNLKKFIVTSISILFNRCHEVYRLVTSPDVDVKRFSAVIVESIEKVKGVPELNRCRDAFNKIKESVSMLENNFSTYYRDMVQTENPNTLIESFIVDVSQGQNMNLGLMRQFRQIINFYKKQSEGKIKDPKIKKLFESLNSRMDILEKRANVKSGAAAAADDESSSDEE